MPVLRPVPDAQPRALGLVRVSKIGERDEDELLSPEIQRVAIEDHCARRGYRLLEPMVEGIDDSGSAPRSRWWKKLDECIAMVEEDRADVLVVWRFSRAARQRLKWAIAIDRVEAAGGLLESATEPLDTSTASGRLARGMLAEFAAYEAETIGAAWRETHARRTSKGLPANGKPRFGYRVQDGLHRPDPVEAPVLAELYRRYVAGESMYSLVGWLNAEGVLTVPGYTAGGPGPWSQTALRRMLDTGFGAGYITVHGEPQRGAHEPVIDVGTWTAYQAARAARRTHRRSERSTYLLSGMVRCQTVLADGQPCGSPMGAGLFGHARQPKFRCIAAQTERRHLGGYVTMPVVEDEVMAWLHRLADKVEPDTDAMLAQQAQRSRRAQDAKALHRQMITVDKALAKVTVDQARDESGLPASVWNDARADLLAEKKRLAERARQAEVDATADEPAKIAADLVKHWRGYSVEQRRGLLRKVIREVRVEPQRPKSRVEIVANWDG